LNKKLLRTVVEQLSGGLKNNFHKSEIFYWNTHLDIWEYLCTTDNSSIVNGVKYKNALKRGYHVGK
jgi:hypothetical protein